MTECEVFSQKRPARILIVDDHPMVREGLASRIAKQSDMQICGEAEDVDDALEEIKTTEPDLVVVDISLKSGSGIDLIKRIKARHANVKTLVASMYDETLYAERALQAGARGYVNKQEIAEKVIEAIRCVLDGEVFFSPQMTQRMMQRAVHGGDQPRSLVETLSDRELEVFRLIGQGRKTGAIARQLHRSVHTIDTYRSKIKAKLHLKDGAELNRSAVQWVLENG